MFGGLLAVLMLLLFQEASGQPFQEKMLDLPPAQGSYAEGVTHDWLIDSADTQASVFRDEEGKALILSNGLIARTFRLAPNAATISLKKLKNQEELIRAVKPEAVVEIEGYTMDVGGLTGQPNLAFLYPDWIEQLEADPASFVLHDFEVGKPLKRFEWRQVRHHAPDAQWPPPGIRLRMEYRLPALSVEHLLTVSQESRMGRETLIEDAFTSLSSAWSIHTSEAHERSSFINEGKPGEIYTPKNTAVYAEQALPGGVGLVETTIDPGTDQSAAWGPGIALVWPDRVVKLNLQTGSEEGARLGPWKFIVYDGDTVNNEAGGKSDAMFDQPWSLRLRIEGRHVWCEVKPQDGPWRTLEGVDFGRDVPDPVAVRIGKLGREGAGKDHEHPGEIVRLKVNRFAAYSRLQPAHLEAIQQSLDVLHEVAVAVQYELYDGIPVLSKWVEVHNESVQPIRVDNIVSEYLGLADHDPYDAHQGRRDLIVRPNLLVDTDYAFSAWRQAIANRQSVHWETDQAYVTQINYRQETENMLRVYPYHGYHVTVEPEASLASIRTFILPYDSYDKERNGLAMRRMYRTIAPWVTENPLMFHLTRSGWEEFTRGVDQAAEVGYEMVNFSFGSGFRPDDDSDENYQAIKRYVDYAARHDIALGTYSLLASRRISEEDDVINPATGKRGGFAIYNNSPCLGSVWGQNYFANLYRLFGEGGLMTLTHDGNYPGDICASRNHPGHEGLADSQYLQWKIITDFYKWAKGQGVYLRVPDYYFLAGSNQNVVGYRELNWSLPRRQQLLHTRQNIFDGTWESTPSMRWAFIPLQQYHGGGVAATVEPLHEHIDHYEMMLVSNLGMGLQSVLRGPRLYDTGETRAMVTRVVDWFKKYRTILESDLLHLRRADGRDIDYMMHVNPTLKEKGLLLVFNPTDQPVRKTITVPLYYTGLEEVALIREQEGAPQRYLLNRAYEVDLEVEVAPNWYNWYVVE